MTVCQLPWHPRPQVDVDMGVPLDTPNLGGSLESGSGCSGRTGSKVPLYTHTQEDGSTIEIIASIGISNFRHRCKTTMARYIRWPKMQYVHSSAFANEWFEVRLLYRICTVCMKTNGPPPTSPYTWCYKWKERWSFESSKNHTRILCTFRARRISVPQYYGMHRSEE